jgi:hypothetical protein
MIHHLTNNSLKFSYLLSIFVLALFLSSCQDPITVGVDLVEDDRINLRFTDTFNLSSYTIPGDRIITFRKNVDSRTYMIGQLNDPIFGAMEAELFIRPLLPSTKPNFEDAVFDSLVLSLQFDTLGNFGQRITAQKIDIFQLKNKFPIKDTVFSDIDLEVESRELASYSGIFRVKDSVTVFDPALRKLLRYAPHMRIKLDDGIGSALFGNSAVNKEDTLFTNYFKGMKLKATPISDASTLGFNLSDANILSEGTLNKMIMYYHKKTTNAAGRDTTIYFQYDYRIDGNTYSKFKHNITNTTALDLIQNPVKGNEYTLLQGASGVKSVIKIDDLSFLKDKLINKVELDLFVANLPGQNNAIAYPRQLVASRYNKEGKLEFIPDIKQLADNGVSFALVFGGALETKNNVSKYTINLTNHVKNILEQPDYRPEIILGILTEAETAARAVFYGGKHPNYPMKLRVSYTLK